MSADKTDKACGAEEGDVRHSSKKTTLTAVKDSIAKEGHNSTRASELYLDLNFPSSSGSTSHVSDVKTAHDDLEVQAWIANYDVENKRKDNAESTRTIIYDTEDEEYTSERYIRIINYDTESQEKSSKDNIAECVSRMRLQQQQAVLVEQNEQEQEQEEGAQNVHATYRASNTNLQRENLRQSVRATSSDYSSSEQEQAGLETALLEDDDEEEKDHISIIYRRSQFGLQRDVELKNVMASEEFKREFNNFPQNQVNNASYTLISNKRNNVCQTMSSEIEKSDTELSSSSSSSRDLRASCVAENKKFWVPSESSLFKSLNAAVDVERAKVLWARPTTSTCSFASGEEVLKSQNHESLKKEKSINEFYVDKRDRLLEVKCAEYEKHTVTNLAGIIFEKNIAPSCIVEIGHTSIYCHLFVLQCFSDFFARLGNIRKIKLPEECISETGFRMFYAWCLSGKTQLRPRTVVNLIKVAQYLRCRDLVDQCNDYLVQDTIFVEDIAFKVYLDARTLKVDAVAYLMLTRISKFFLTMVSCSEFLDLTPIDMQKILSSNNIAVNTEAEVLFALVRWLDFRWEERQEHSLSLTREIRFGLLPSWYLYTLMRGTGCEKVDRVVGHPQIELLMHNSMIYAMKRGEQNVSRDKLLAKLKVTDAAEPTERIWINDPLLEDEVGGSHMSYEDFLKYLTILRSKGRCYWKLLKRSDNNNDNMYHNNDHMYHNTNITHDISKHSTLNQERTTFAMQPHNIQSSESSDEHAESVASCSKSMKTKSLTSDDEEESTFDGVEKFKLAMASKKKSFSVENESSSSF